GLSRAEEVLKNEHNQGNLCSLYTSSRTWLQVTRKFNSLYTNAVPSPPTASPPISPFHCTTKIASSAVFKSWATGSTFKDGAINVPLIRSISHKKLYLSARRVYNRSSFPRIMPR